MRRHRASASSSASPVTRTARPSRPMASAWRSSAPTTRTRPTSCRRRYGSWTCRAASRATSPRRSTGPSASGPGATCRWPMRLPARLWLDDETLVAVVGDNGRNLPYRFGLDGTATPMMDATSTDRGRRHRGRQAARSRSPPPSTAGPARSGWSRSGGLRQVTREGSAWLRRFPTVELTELSLDGPGGPIQAWLASPVGAGRQAAADRPPHPRRADRRLGAGRHDRRDRAVRGRVPRPHAEHPRLGHVRQPVGQGALDRMGRRRRSRCDGIRRRPRPARPRRPRPPRR